MEPTSKWTIVFSFASNEKSTLISSFTYTVYIVNCNRLWNKNSRWLIELVLHQFKILFPNDTIWIQYFFQESLGIPNQANVLFIAFLRWKYQTLSDVLPRKLVFGKSDTPIKFLQINRISELVIQRLSNICLIQAEEFWLDTFQIHVILSLCSCRRTFPKAFPLDKC